MLKIKDNQINLILQVEEQTNINEIMSRLSLFTDHILIICPKVFLERLVQYFYDISDFTTGALEAMADDIEKEQDYTQLGMIIKGKKMIFHFIITDSKSKVIDNPFRGMETYKVGIKEIKI